MTMRTLELYLLHGRHDPDQDMSGCGFMGPKLTGVTRLTCIYTVHEVWFVSEEAKKIAQAQTGWTDGTDHQVSLIVPYKDDLVECTLPGSRKTYFGDWWLGTTDTIRFHAI